MSDVTINVGDEFEVSILDPTARFKIIAIDGDHCWCKKDPDHWADGASPEPYHTYEKSDVLQCTKVTPEGNSRSESPDRTECNSVPEPIKTNGNVIIDDVRGDVNILVNGVEYG